MGKLCGHFAFLCAQIVHTWVPCSTGLAMLGSVNTFFHKDETMKHFHHGMQQSTGYSYVQSWKPAPVTETSTVDGDVEQLFRVSRPCTMCFMCSYACAKGFHFLSFDFARNVKAAFRQKLNLFFMSKKKKLGNSLNNSISLKLADSLGDVTHYHMNITHMIA